MLAEKFAADIELPQVGSVGFRRGTAQRARVLRRDEPEDAEEPRTCLVQLFDWVPASRFGPGRWEPVPGSSGNATIEERDLFATEQEALFPNGLPPRRRSRQ